MPSPLDDPTIPSPSLHAEVNQPFPPVPPVSQTNPPNTNTVTPPDPNLPASELPTTSSILNSDQQVGSSIENDPPLAIEAPHPEVKEEEEVHTLDLGEGNVVKLDKLGPMIINSDGTLSRIQNWQDLHPIEQERTVRLLIKKRNLVRLEKLQSGCESPETT
ncbi:hypothetical protein M231_03094 [Tremella mesenterica]|uniref:Uncharacterized protein n=1 Tax=Tremella mesenterica TaxID=5217 RepID=A0A4Q1BPA2_TREME|nr:hypothetical protein M231_03094 [Tremella mesenterica]